MAMSRRWLVIGLMVLVVALSACSDADNGGNDDSLGTDVASSDGDPGGDGNSGTGEGGAQAPDVEGLTVPLAPSADAVLTSEAGDFTIVQFIVPLDEQQATISFYDDWTSSQADEYQRTESANGGASWQNAPATGAEKHLITVLSPLDGDDFVAVTLSVGPAE